MTDHRLIKRKYLVGTYLLEVVVISARDEAAIRATFRIENCL